MTIAEKIVRGICKNDGIVSSNKEWNTLKESGSLKIQQHEDCYILLIGKRKRFVVATKKDSPFGKECEKVGVPMIFLG